MDKLLSKEVKESFMIGECSIPPVAYLLGNLQEKKTLIIDLSSLHGSTVPSINSLVPNPDFSMEFTTIDHTTPVIRLPGLGLSKADITRAFKVQSPSHPPRQLPSFHHPPGRVPTTLPCIWLSVARKAIFKGLCCTSTNNYKLLYVIHPLDDFLTIMPPSSPPSCGLNMVLCIILDSKQPRYWENLSDFLTQFKCPSGHRCTKLHLLSPLGDLNYTVRIILQDPFRHTSFPCPVPYLCSHVTLDEACEMELKL